MLSEISVLGKAENLVPFTIERTIVLSKKGFLNLVTDFTVEREYFQKYRPLCKIDDQGAWHCLLVELRGYSEGLLIMVDDFGIPRYAALFWKTFRYPDTSENTLSCSPWFSGINPSPLI
jgi:hypothetical protein